MEATTVTVIPAEPPAATMQPSGGAAESRGGLASPCPSSPLSPAASPTFPGYSGDLETLVRLFKDLDTGVPVSTRTCLLRTYRDCFVGDQAVSWMVRHGVATSREQAVDLGNWLMTFGVFYHVTRDQPFKDASCCYYMFDPEWPRAPTSDPYLSQPVTVKKSFDEATPNLLIIGGGMGGALAAKLLQDLYRVTLVDTKDYFENTPALPKVLANHALYVNNVVPHVSYLPSGSFVRDTVVALADHSATLSSGRVLRFDYCIIASGSSYTPPIKVRVGDSSQPFTIQDRQTMLREVSADIQKSDSVIVIGGGPVGVEIASEIVSQWPRKRLTLVSSANTLLERLPPAAGEKALRWFQKRGVEVRFGEKVQFPEDDNTGSLTVRTDLGHELKADLLLRMVGITPNSQFVKFPDAVNPQGQVRVNEHLQLPSHPHIFAVGDVNDRPEEKMALAAELQSHYVVQVLTQLWTQPGSVPHPYIPKPFQMLVNLGGRAGVYISFGRVMPVPDFVVGRLKHEINKVGIHTISGCYPGSLKSGSCFTCAMVSSFNSCL